MRTKSYFESKDEASIISQVVTADVNGDGVDISDANEALIIANVGASGDTLDASNYLEVEIEDSPDDSTYTDAVDAALEKTVTGNNTGTICKVAASGEASQSYRSAYKKQDATITHIRAVANVTGTHTNGIGLGVTIVKFGLPTMPAA